MWALWVDGVRGVPTSELVIQISTFASAVQTVLVNEGMGGAPDEEQQEYILNAFREEGAEDDVKVFMAAKAELDRRIPVE